MTKESFFEYIDFHGIDGEWKSGMSISIDPYHDNELPYEKELDVFFELRMYGFNLSQEDKIDFIKDYFRETYNIHINNINELTKLYTLHGNLFLIPVSPYTKKEKLSFNYNSQLITFTVVKKHFKHSIYLRDIYNVKDLGVIETIDGDLFLSNTTIKSLNPLKEINGDFWISGLSKEYLEDLGNLEKVTGNLNLSKSKILNLGNLKYVGGNLNLRSTSIIDLSNLIEIQGNLFLNKKYKNEYILKSEIVKGNIKYFNV
jgi:hypothetical protein